MGEGYVGTETRNEWLLRLEMPIFRSAMRASALTGGAYRNSTMHSFQLKRGSNKPPVMALRLQTRRAVQESPFASGDAAKS